MNPEPYVSFKPGQLITAEGMNAMQVEVQNDIDSTVDTAKKDLKKEGVERADTADHFDGKSPKTWVDTLDERYAPKVHDHEGLAGYRRYFRQLDDQAPLVLLEHGLGRFPVVDVYELRPISFKGDATATPQLLPANFVLYYGHEESDLLQDFFPASARRLPRRGLGVKWETLLDGQVGGYPKIKYDDDDSLSDVINDFLDAYFALPHADEMSHRLSKWIEDNRDDRTVGELKKRDEWDNIRWVVLPKKLGVGMPETPVAGASHRVDVTHLTYDVVALTLPDGAPPHDLMIIVRS